MSEITTGRVVWHELHTGDRRRALDFYCVLMGWQTREVLAASGEPYGLCAAHGRDHAGVLRSRAPGQAALWLPYMATDDVDAATVKAERLGARVVSAPADIPNVGRYSVLTDPQGAAFALHRHATSQPVEPRAPPLGSFCWEDLRTHDPAQAGDFYASLLGYDVETVDLGPLGAYRLLRRGARLTAGITTLPPDLPGAHWLTYLHVKDVDRAVRNAREIGAAVRVPPRDLPGVGRFAVLLDPTGAVFAVFRGKKGS